MVTRYMPRPTKYLCQQHKKLRKHGGRWYCDQCISGVDDGVDAEDSSSDAVPSLQHKTTMNKLDVIERSIIKT